MGILCQCEQRDRKKGRYKLSCKRCQKETSNFFLIVITGLIIVFIMGFKFTNIIESYGKCEKENDNYFFRLSCKYEIPKEVVQVTVSGIIIFSVFTIGFCLVYIDRNEIYRQEMCGDHHNSCQYCLSKRYYRFFIQLFGLFKLNSIRGWLKKRALQI